MFVGWVGLAIKILTNGNDAGVGWVYISQVLTDAYVAVGGSEKPNCLRILTLM